MAKKKTAKRSTRQNGPNKVSVTMYDVGFGDCFLLSFCYANNEKRHVLIDCGSTSKKKPHLKRVVDEIVKDCQGHVDAIVATHRHKDHISVFGLNGLGKKFEALKPHIVIQPWTEHPNAKKGALKAPTVFTSGAANHMMGLAAAQEFAQHLTDNPNRVLAATSPQTRRYLTRIASLSIPNKKAILCLTRMGKKHAYVYTGGPSGLEQFLPGVRVTVLGPPTLEQCKNIKRQKQWDDAEFWKLHSRLSAASQSNVATARGHSDLFPHAKVDTIAGAASYAKWIIHKLDTTQLQNVRRIVRALDDAINNTSVILLFEVGNKRLLFSGDAQLENWQYALEDKTLKARLRQTSLYKVGHHGSTNATPQSLWALFRRRRARRQRLITLLSTEAGHHNKVPRQSLLDALESETILHSTERWRNKLKETYII